MNIGFFFKKTTEDSIIHLEFAKHMLASVRQVMPNVPVTQFTDLTSPILDGVDSFVRLPEDMPMALMRMTHHASCLGDWLFCDPDIIFKNDIQDVFDEPFDVALTDREGTYMEHTDYAEEQPYNTGVVFSRNPDFFKEVIRQLKQYPNKLQEWEGDQRVICNMAMDQETPFDIIVIPGLTHNFTPETQHEDVSHASILHYKGARKAWIK